MPEHPYVWNARIAEWVATFRWACGAEGTASTCLDPNDPKNLPNMLFMLRSSQRRDCPECRMTEIHRQPAPRGHHPTHTHQSVP